MKQNPNFMLRRVVDAYVLVPVGEATRKFPGMVNLNDTSVFLWECLAQEQTLGTLVDALVDTYEVTEQEAREDTENFLETLQKIGAVV